MLEQLLNHINQHALCKTTDKILLAVSGGLDSMVMLHLLREAGFSVGVAHCNFQLRGEASDEDERWVSDVCQQQGLPFFVRRFDTTQYASTNGISVQMAARDLRYAYFAELLDSQHYDLVATGHHFNDVIESVILNLIRGTGIDGFRGVASKKEKIIRPLLFASRKMIHAYAREKVISWREDASNASDDYHRNFIRHQIIPRMEEVNPSFEDGFRGTRDRILGARALMVDSLNAFRDVGVEAGSRETRIDIQKVARSAAPEVLLWELIKHLGFKYDDCIKIVREHQPGKIFHSTSHQLVVDRTHYIVEKKQRSDFQTVSIPHGQERAGEPPFQLLLRQVSIADFQLVKSNELAQLDADLLQYPLLWRKWQAGDYFVPLGMQQEKKLSDFLIDLKTPFNSKADITVLQSGNEIACVVGFRISDRYKVTEATRRVVVVEQRQGYE